MAKVNFPGKLYDSTTTPAKTSALEKWWSKEGMRMMLETAGDAKLPASEKFWDAQFLEQKYCLEGFQFGNWLSQEDRYNYLMNAGAGLYHLSHTVLQVAPKFIGLNKLSVCFGSRGIRKSYAHFSGSLSLIHINRWKRSSGDRQSTYLKMFKDSPQYGSFAHEFGHWMDCLNGDFSSGGRLVLMGTRDSVLNGASDTAKYHQEQIFKVLFFNGNKPTAWCEQFMAIKATEYWYRRTEIWARYFEATVSMILEQNKIPSTFICHPAWYAMNAYPPTELLLLALPHFKRYVAAWTREAKVLKKS